MWKISRVKNAIVNWLTKDDRLTETILPLKVEKAQQDGNRRKPVIFYMPNPSANYNLEKTKEKFEKLGYTDLEVVFKVSGAVEILGFPPNNKKIAQTPSPPPATQPSTPAISATTPMPNTPCPTGKMWVEDGSGGWVCAGPGEVIKKGQIEPSLEDIVEKAVIVDLKRRVETIIKETPGFIDITRLREHLNISSKDTLAIKRLRKVLLDLVTSGIIEKTQEVNVFGGIYYLYKYNAKRNISEATKKGIIHEYDPNEVQMFGEIDTMKDLVRNKYRIGINIEEAKELLAWLEDQDLLTGDEEYFYAVESWLKSRGWKVQSVLKRKGQELAILQDLAEENFGVALSNDQSVDLLRWLWKYRITSQEEKVQKIGEWIDLQGLEKTLVLNPLARQIKAADIVSILEPLLPEVEKQINTKVPLQDIKQFIIENVEKHKIKDEDKRRIKWNIGKQQTPEALQKYLYNSILKYEGHGVVSKQTKEEGRQSALYELVRDKYGITLENKEVEKLFRYLENQDIQTDDEFYMDEIVNWLKRGGYKISTRSVTVARIASQNGRAEIYAKVFITKEELEESEEVQKILGSTVPNENKANQIKDTIYSLMANKISQKNIDIKDWKIDPKVDIKYDEGEIQAVVEEYNEGQAFEKVGKKGQLLDVLQDEAELEDAEPLKAEDNNVFDWVIETYEPIDICERTGLPDDVDLLEYKEEITQSFLPSYEEQIENSGFDWLFSDNDTDASEDIYDEDDGCGIIDGLEEAKELDELEDTLIASKKQALADDLVSEVVELKSKGYPIDRIVSLISTEYPNATNEDIYSAISKTERPDWSVLGNKKSLKVKAQAQAQMEKTVPAPITPVNPVDRTAPLKPGEIPVILEDEVTEEKAKPKDIDPEAEATEKKVDLSREEQVKRDVTDLRENIIDVAKSTFSIEISEQQVTDLLGKIMGFLMEEIAEVTLGRVQDIVGDLLPRKASKLSNRKA